MSIQSVFGALALICLIVAVFSEWNRRKAVRNISADASKKVKGGSRGERRRRFRSLWQEAMKAVA